MPDEKLISMIRLLDDPDKVVFQAVRAGILKTGNKALPKLLETQSQNLPEIQQKRITELINEIRIRGLRKELKTWSLSKDNDILYGAYLINKYQHPEVRFELIEDQIYRLANKVFDQLNITLSGLQQIRLFNNFLYKQEKFVGDFKNVGAPQNFFLTDIFKNKKGNDISLGILYASVAQKIGIPLQFIDFPRNMLLAFIDNRKNPDFFKEKDVVFYINPFNKGAVVTRSDINTFLRMHKIKTKKNYFLPCPNTVIIRRLITALINSYKFRKDFNKVKDMKRLLNAVK